jgi:TfoX/Sxy family transcriptional regulator of competence genes
MPYDQLLAERVRRALVDRTDMVEKAMFGGLAFMVSGNMCCGVNRDDLIIRLDARTTAEQLNSPHVRPWDFMPSRPMPGMFAVSGQGSAEQDAVDKWVKLALNHATSLPAKIKGPKSRGASSAKRSTSRGKRRK